MGTYAVVAQWRMDLDKSELQETERERIIPGVSGMPGFVHGRWTKAADGIRHLVFVEFDTEANARDFAKIVDGDDNGERAAAGVAKESVEVVEIIGSA